MARFTCLITSGPTREYIDPVRYISNASSGKMGYALAAQAAKRGWNVLLVSGPVAQPAPEGVRVVKVVSARDMFNAVKKHFAQCDVLIGAAAVADWRPRTVSRVKIKKSIAAPVIRLTPNPDILKEMGRRKTGQVLVGFALETNGLIASARKKLLEKNLDLIVANKPGVIGKDSSEVLLIGAGGKPSKVRGSKTYIAKRILDAIH
jgi:phosphopantothenoylcysteine synthetase/decarboxylase